jgi:hypothetical protein
MSELQGTPRPTDAGPAFDPPSDEGVGPLVGRRRRWRVVRPRDVEPRDVEPERRTARHRRSGVQPAPRLIRLASDAGMATAEYAIATLAAVGFAGLLVVILKSDEVRGLLTGIVRQALTL